MPLEPQQPNYFVRIAIAIFSLSLAVMCGYRFLSIEPRGQIDTGLLSVICIIVVLVLSEAFDNFSIGKLVSVSREVSKKDKSIEKLEHDRDSLLNQLVSLSVNQTQNQHQNHTNVYGDYNAAPVVSRATGQEIEEKKDAEIAAQVAAVEEKIPVTPAPSTRQPVRASEDGSRQDQAPASRMRMNLAKVEEIAFIKYIEACSINIAEVTREVKLVGKDQAFDPISTMPIIFDAYLKKESGEVFVEFKTTNTSPTFRDRLYVMLSKLHHYQTAKRTRVQLDLVIVKIPGESERFGGFSRILRDFTPAKNSGLLNTHEIEFTQEEATSCMEAWGNLT
jgi:hypothetical protein